MKFGRRLGLDIGLKHTGVALSDELGMIASALTVVDASQKKDWLQKILKIIEENEVIEIVVGLPLNQYGEWGKDAERIGQYMVALREKTTLPVIEWDERFTTVQAERMLIEADLSRKRRKQVIDKVAAVIILQSYLDSQTSDSNLDP
jgi:putative holliday junction resolvase